MNEKEKKYDQHCLACGWTGEIYALPFHNPPCPRCGGQTERIYLGGYDFQGDEIVGGMTIENMGHEPVTVFSKSEYKRELEKRGLVQNVRHVGTPGSDKSPNTQRWV